jgi:MFS family permease
VRFSSIFSGPPGLPRQQQINFRNVVIDSIGVGFASAAGPFLPVFLTRLGASSFQVGLLTAMPALTGLLLAIPMGQYLQRQSNPVRWFSLSRLGVILGYALTGILSFLLPADGKVNGTLLIWALVTVPQTMLSITFSVVMNAVAGPHLRFDLMTRRWSILGVTTALTVFAIGQVLVRIPFPVNYQVVFIFLSLGGLVSYYFSNQIKIPGQAVPPTITTRRSLRATVRDFLAPIRSESPFLSFVSKRFVYLTGTSLAIPLFPLYFVRAANLRDSTIATINTAQTVIMIVGYIFWTQTSRRRGSRAVLLWTTFGLSIYPMVVALTTQGSVIVFLAGAAGIFQAGLDLVFFDELLKRVPAEYSATFVSFAQSLQYFSSFIAPMIGTLLADTIGLPLALGIAGGIRLVGFLMFAFGRDRRPVEVEQAEA